MKPGEVIEGNLPEVKFHPGVDFWNRVQVLLMKAVQDAEDEFDSTGGLTPETARIIRDLREALR